MCKNNRIFLRKLCVNKKRVVMTLLLWYQRFFNIKLSRNSDLFGTLRSLSAASLEILTLTETFRLVEGLPLPGLAPP